MQNYWWESSPGHGPDKTEVFLQIVVVLVGDPRGIPPLADLTLLDLNLDFPAVYCSLKWANDPNQPNLIKVIS